MSDSPARPSDAWANGEAYERYVGRWSRLVARKFLAWLAVPDGGDWLDVGCGTGVLANAILATCKPRRVKGVDRSDGFVAMARESTADTRVTFEVGDAQALSLETARYDAVVSGLMLNFLAEPGLAATGMMRAAKPGGVVGAYVWDYAGRMDMMQHLWEAAVALDPDAAGFQEGSRFALCKPEPLLDLFTAAGLQGTRVRAVDIATVFRSFDDYWSPFLGGQGPAPSYVMSLSEDGRTALRERVHASLPIAADGTIALTARAWAVRGVSPNQPAA